MSVVLTDNNIPQNIEDVKPLPKYIVATFSNEGEINIWLEEKSILGYRILNHPGAILHYPCTTNENLFKISGHYRTKIIMELDDEIQNTINPFPENTDDILKTGFEGAVNLLNEIESLCKNTPMQEWLADVFNASPNRTESISEAIAYLAFKNK